jgi:hypothetical protein
VNSSVGYLFKGSDIGGIPVNENYNMINIGPRTHIVDTLEDIEKLFNSAKIGHNVYGLPDTIPKIVEFLKSTMHREGGLKG